MTDEQRMVPGRGSDGEPHLRPPTLAALSLTQDPVGQPSGVLSFLPYSQTLGPSSPLSADSLFRSTPSDVRAQPWGVRPLSRDISPDSLILCFSRRPCLTARLRPGGRFRCLGTSSGIRWKRPCTQSPLWMPPASLHAREQDDQRMMELGVQRRDQERAPQLCGRAPLRPVSTAVVFVELTQGDPQELGGFFLDLQHRLCTL